MATPGGVATILDLLNNDDVRKKFTADMDDYFKVWFKRLAEWLIKNNHTNIDRKRFRYLYRNFHGGGSPTMAWLKKMETEKPQENVGRLKECARKYKRADVLEILGNLKDDALIGGLDEGVCAQIADYLDERIVAVSDWTSFASYFGYKYADLQQFRSTQITPGQFSPTEQLLAILSQENTHLSMDLFIEWAKTEDRIDIANDLEHFKNSVLVDRNREGAEGRNQGGVDGGNLANDEDPENFTSGYALTNPAVGRPIQCQDSARSLGQDSMNRAGRSPSTETTNGADGTNSQDDGNSQSGNPDGMDSAVVDGVSDMRIDDENLPPWDLDVNSNGEPDPC